MGCAGWSYDDVLPYFRKLENNERGESDIHSVGGLLDVSDTTVKGEVCDAGSVPGLRLAFPMTKTPTMANKKVLARIRRRSNKADGPAWPKLF